MCLFTQCTPQSSVSLHQLPTTKHFTDTHLAGVQEIAKSHLTSKCLPALSFVRLHP